MLGKSARQRMVQVMATYHYLDLIINQMIFNFTLTMFQLGSRSRHFKIRGYLIDFLHIFIVRIEIGQPFQIPVYDCR